MSVTSQNLVDTFAQVMESFNLQTFDFDAAFRSWELQAGYPIITVSYNEQSRQFSVVQQRYFTNKAQATNEPSSWYIPLNFATPSASNFEDTTFSHYFVNNQDVFMIDVPAQFNAGDWFVFNKQQLGYYRVNYDANNWNALIATLNSNNYNQIHVLNRVQLIDDAVNFASGGYLEYEVLFDILSYLHRETEYTPWFSADRFISTLYTTFGALNEDLNVSFLQFNSFKSSIELFIF